ncbi:MAG TPA: dTDP-4-dehydrorhamnose 3,5-epimerase [Chloroflexota bacterium]|jgi:dTDP-4-dehydrorhamnose 3,5-epimerase
MAKTTSTYVTPTTLRGVFLVERPVHADARGFFHEVERRGTDLRGHLDRHVQHMQWNHSRSQRGVLRGIHVAEWNKCVYVVRGEAQVVIVDARPDSPTFGRYQSFLLGEDNRAMLFVPAGCGNSVLVLSDEVDFMYSVDAEWYAGGEVGVAWDDPDLAIPWQTAALHLSEKDQHNPRLRDRFPEKFAP